LLKYSHVVTAPSEFRYEGTLKYILLIFHGRVGEKAIFSLQLGEVAIQEMLCLMKHMFNCTLMIVGISNSVS
jgi:hypothetical protein